VTSQSAFEVRAAPGYVPPPKETEPQALPFNAPESNNEGDTAVDAPADPFPISPTSPNAGAEEVWTTDTETLPYEPAEPTFPGDLADPLPLSPSPMANLNFEDSRPSSPGFLGKPAEVESFSNETGTDPAFRESSQLPKADPKEDHLGIQSWTELPLPSPKSEPRESPKPPSESAKLEEIGPNKLERLVEIMREDPYVAFMGAGIVLILLLLLTLFVLG
jgi:hypothetical protein